MMPCVAATGCHCYWESFTNAARIVSFLPTYVEQLRVKASKLPYSVDDNVQDQSVNRFAPEEVDFMGCPSTAQREWTGDY